MFLFLTMYLPQTSSAFGGRAECTVHGRGRADLLFPTLLLTEPYVIPLYIYDYLSDICPTLLLYCVAITHIPLGGTEIGDSRPNSHPLRAKPSLQATLHHLPCSRRPDNADSTIISPLITLDIIEYDEHDKYIHQR